MAPDAIHSSELPEQRAFAYGRHALCGVFVGFIHRVRVGRWLTALLLLLPFLGTGCGTFVAHRIVQAPNTYPTWLAPAAPVLLSFNYDLLTNSPSRFAEVGPPAARLHYRVVEPAEYHLKIISTNWVEHGEERYQFDFHAKKPQPNAWAGAPRGTVFLLHGYGLAEFSMVPWALRLSEDGWRCVLVDLRGHGLSNGKQIYYGLTEARDMEQLLDVLTNQTHVSQPVAVIGDSYGAALALRWKTVDPRVGPAVAMAPYGVLSNAVLNLCQDYARCLPQAIIRAGLKQLPVVLGASAADLDTTTVLARHPVTALFVAGSKDNIIPLAEMQNLYAKALPGSKLIVVPGATHENLSYHFGELVPPVLEWLDTNGQVR
jgi:pimeloyl-ACP methyl ester carboxylesterase